MAEDEDIDITPQQKVFDTAELLEDVLLCLPMKDILLDQRVCKTWKNGIDGSIKLQKALFMRPAGYMRAEEFEKHMPEFVVGKPTEAYYRIFANDCTINPLLHDKLTGGHLAHFIAGELDDSALSISFQLPQASWRRMLAMQPQLPPIKLVRCSPFNEAPAETPQGKAFDAKFRALMRRLGEGTFYSQLQMSVRAVSLRDILSSASAHAVDGSGNKECKNAFCFEFKKHDGQVPQSPSNSDQTVLWAYTGC